MFLILAAATALLALATALPLLPLSHGLVRIGDFPRQQILAAAAILLAALLVLSDGGAWRILQAVLAIVVLAQLPHVLRFTPLWRKQSADADGGGDASASLLRLVSCNVKQSNRRFAELSAELEAADPDIVVLMEVDAAWKRGLDAFLAGYAHVVAKPQDNSYGLILASRFKLDEIEAQDLLTEGVPSIIARVTVPSGQAFRLFCIHPEPPVLHRGTEGRDGETALIALKARDETLPVIVTGDLNDVAWSVTTERFRRVSGLMDPRIGRRIFSTFDARYRLVRWPLDHLFHSAQFRIGRMERLKPCGSDHFPVLFELELHRSAAAESTPAAADAQDLEKARDIVEVAHERDEAPIGTDWEK